MNDPDKQNLSALGQAIRLVESLQTDKYGNLNPILAVLKAISNDILNPEVFRSRRRTHAPVGEEAIYLRKAMLVVTAENEKLGGELLDYLLQNKIIRGKEQVRD